MFCREQVAQLRGRREEIRAKGAELVIIGNGSREFATAFGEEYGVDALLLVDPDLRAYRAAGLRRGHVEVLSPRLPLNALRALRRGARQGTIQGDPWQLGGVFIVRPGGELAYRYISREAGDHPDLDAVLDALSADRPGISEKVDISGVQYWLGRSLGSLIDPTIVLSFSRPGFSIRSLSFRPDDLEVDLHGKRCVITGGNSGIGYEVALGLADLGATVVLLCRSLERGEAAAGRIREMTGNASVSAELLDVSRVASMRAVARRLASHPVDVLVHNAGVLPETRCETDDGLELTLATHVVGPFVLTHLLREALEASADARLIWVSSGGMYTQRLRLDDLNWARRSYDGLRAYAETKRAQVILAELWADRLRGTSVVSNSMHPGWADTPGVRSSIPTFWRLSRRLLRTPAEGADTIVWLAACKRARHWTGQFFFDREPRCTHLLPWTRESPEDRAGLWGFCERHLGAGLDGPCA